MNGLGGTNLVSFHAICQKLGTENTLGVQKNCLPVYGEFVAFRVVGDLAVGQLFVHAPKKNLTQVLALSQKKSSHLTSSVSVKHLSSSPDNFLSQVPWPDGGAAKDERANSVWGAIRVAQANRRELLIAC